jgi:Na+-driven multidrug efflux pump
MSQNYGAGNFERCRRVFKVSFGLQILFTVVVSGIILMFARPLLSIFNNDPSVLEVGTIRLTYVMTTEVLNASVEMLSSAMRGLGQSMKPALISMIGICGVRITWVYTVFADHKTIGCLMVAYPLSWAVTTAVLAVAYYMTAKKALPVEQHS